MDRIQKLHKVYGKLVKQMKAIWSHFWNLHMRKAVYNQGGPGEEMGIIDQEDHHLSHITFISLRDNLFKLFKNKLMLGEQ